MLILNLVDGGWSNWTACDELCDGGMQNRSCNNPEARNGGNPCVGNTTRVCNTHPCGMYTIYFIIHFLLPSLFTNLENGHFVNINLHQTFV